jgi:hypothetical protein
MGRISQFVRVTDPVSLEQFTDMILAAFMCVDMCVRLNNIITLASAVSSRTKKLQ